MYDDENVIVEYKSREIEPRKIAKEIIAFSNTRGGTIIFGIEDNGSVVGVNNPKKLEETIVNISRNNFSRNNCEPPIVPEFERQIKEEKAIVRVKVPKGDDVPYKSKTDGKFYIRVGSTVREASNIELIRLFSEGPYKQLILMLARLTNLKNEIYAALEIQSKEGDNVAVLKTLELKRAILDLGKFEGVLDGLRTILDIGRECSIQYFQTGKNIESMTKISQIISKIGAELEYSVGLDASQAEQIWQLIANTLTDMIRVSFDIERSAEPFRAILPSIEDVAVEAYKRDFNAIGFKVAMILRDFREHLEFWQSHIKEYKRKSLPENWIEVWKLAKEGERYFPINENERAKPDFHSYEIQDYYLFNQAFIEGWGGDWLDQAFKSNPDRILKASVFLNLWQVGHGTLMRRVTYKCICGEVLKEIASLKGFLGDFNEFYLHLYDCEKCHRKTVGFFHKF